MSKYGSRKITLDGITFHSKKEANRYAELKLLERGGLIQDLRLQVPFTILKGYKNGEGKVVRPIKYIADFTYYENGSEIIEDVKGYRTEIYRLKKKLFEKEHYPLTIREV